MISNNHYAKRDYCEELYKLTKWDDTENIYASVEFIDEDYLAIAHFKYLKDQS